MKNVNIFLKNENGYKWFSNKNFFVKAYLFDEKNELFEDKNIIKYFENYKNIDDLIGKLKLANGLFSLIIKKENFLFIAVDKIRMFPIFYFQDENEILISDDANFIKEKKNISIDENNKLEFLQTGYSTKNKTLLKNVFQIQAGEYLLIEDKKIKKDFYFTYFTENISFKERHFLEKELEKIIYAIFERSLKKIKNNQIVVGLSGGYDSRLIVTSLKKLNCKNVICFTYGRKNNYEIEISKKVAKKLNYKWIFIEYNEKLIENYLQNPTFKKYYKSVSNYSSMFFMQEYFALKYLKDNNLVDENAVFIGGHSADFLAGSHLDIFMKKKFTEKKLIHKIIEKNFSLKKAGFFKKKVFFNEIKKSINFLLEKKKSNLNYLIYENWDFKERQAKFIVNSVLSYDFFGYKFYLPFWDNEFINFFLKLNFEQKLYEKLYVQTIQKKFFEEFDLNFKNELQATKLVFDVQIVKNKIKKYLPFFIKKQFLNKKDWMFYYEITKMMKKELEENNEKKNFNSLDFNSIITAWLIKKQCV